MIAKIILLNIFIFKTNKILLFIVFIQLFSCLSYGQSTDTIDYFPLQFGDKYRYYFLRICPEDSFHLNTPDSSKGWNLKPWIVYKDTLKINGKKYYIIPEFWWSPDTIRVDSNGNLLYYYQGKDELYFKFDAKVNEKWYSILPLGYSNPSPAIFTMESRNDTIKTFAGIFYNCLRIFLKCGYEGEITYWIAPNIGIIAKCSWGDPFVLYEAVINGKKYLPTGIKELNNIINEFTLFQNYPNPFNPETIIRFIITDRGKVKLSIFDGLGREIKQLINNNYPMGSFEVKWDGTNNTGEKVPSGIYIYELTVNDQKISKKLVFIK